jgi:hypothetical protein
MFTRLRVTFDRFRMSSVAPTLVALAILGAFWLLFFWSLLVRRSHFIPWDLVDQHYMFQGFISRTLSGDESLWWSPNIMGGYPAIADPLSALFYPPNFLMHLLMPRDFLPYLALEFQTVLHFLLASVGMFLLARLLTSSTPGGIVAALAWVYGSYFVWHLPHLSPISTLSWLPWILLAFAMAIRHGSLIWTAFTGLGLGLMVLAGHAMTILQVSYLLLGLAILLVWLRRDRGWFERLLPIGVAGGSLAIGIGIGAVQLLPGWQLSGLSERAEFGFADAADSSFAPYWSITALIPNFFSVFEPGEYWAAGDPAETNLYLGLVPLVLAVMGVAGVSLLHRRATLLLLGGIVLSMLLAFGTFAWPFQIVYDLLPGFDQVRRPATFVAFAQFGIALLAAYGVQALLDVQGEPLWERIARWFGIGSIVAFAAAGIASLAMVTTIGEPAQQQFIGIISGAMIAGVILLAAFAIARSRQRFLLSSTTAVGLLLALVAVDLGTAHKAATYRAEEMPPNQYIGEDWVYSEGDDLIPTLREAIEDTGEPARIFPEATSSVWANGPFIWDLHSASGYITLCPVEYCELLDIARADPASPIFDLLNIRFLVTDQPIDEQWGEDTAEKLEIFHDGWTPIYENPDVMPRAWTTTNSIHLPDDEVLSYLSDQSERIGQEVVLSDPDSPQVDGNGDAGSAEIISYENTRVVIEASMPENGYLVLADTYYPGWSATVNGEGSEIYRANHAFRAVHLSEGDHQVEFTYQQPRLMAGAVISVISLVVAFGLAGAGLVIRTRRWNR